MSTTGKEKSPFASVYQIGMIVKNMDEAVKYYEALGIGPFESPKGPAPIVDTKYWEDMEGITRQLLEQEGVKVPKS